jgi:hypothetical protein
LRLGGSDALSLTANWPLGRQNAYNTSATITLAGADGAAYSLSPRREFFLTADDNNLTGCAHD